MISIGINDDGVIGLSILGEFNEAAVLMSPDMARYYATALLMSADQAEKLEKGEEE